MLCWKRHNKSLESDQRSRFVLVKAFSTPQEFNNLNNDLDAYLYDVAEYALGNIDTKPDPKDFGLT